MSWPFGPGSLQTLLATGIQMALRFTDSESPISQRRKLRPGEGQRLSQSWGHAASQRLEKCNRPSASPPPAAEAFPQGKLTHRPADKEKTVTSAADTEARAGKHSRPGPKNTVHPPCLSEMLGSQRTRAPRGPQPPQFSAVGLRNRDK